MNTSIDYLKILVEDIHSTVVATVDDQGRAVTRVIDMMLYDEDGVYFLTAKGKEFYRQLMEQQYISISSIKEKRSISLKGKIRNIGKEKLDEIFEKNTYMQKIYPEDTRDALEVFCLYDAAGEFFDISDPSHIERGQIQIGKEDELPVSGYYAGNSCNGCGACLTVCPQKCIQIIDGKATIDQNHCLHCGRCVNICPKAAIAFQTK